MKAKKPLTDQLRYQAEKSWHHLSSYLQCLHYTVSIVMVMIELEESQYSNIRTSYVYLDAGA
jgi:hypothetical protein